MIKNYVSRVLWNKNESYCFDSGKCRYVLMNAVNEFASRCKNASTAIVNYNKHLVLRSTYNIRLMRRCGYGSYRSESGDTKTIAA